MIRHEYTDGSSWRSAVLGATASGGRFAGLHGVAEDGATRLIAMVETRSATAGIAFETFETLIRPDEHGVSRYPSLTPGLAPAFWYERAIHDLSGLIPDGHPRPDPLLLPLAPGSEHPAPGLETAPAVAAAMDEPGPIDVSGHGMFTLTLGPVRSGAVESVEFLIETPGEDIPHLNIRPHFKHRGMAKRFEGLVPDDAVLIAERVEGIATVAHALAFSHAAEAAAGSTVPPRAQLLRVMLAELERIANHLDVAMRLTEAAGLSVAIARFGWHKEQTMRVMSSLTGSRFGRGAVIPGGVSTGLREPDDETMEELLMLRRRIVDDARRIMRTPSFLDRIRGTGRLSPEYAENWRLLGPIGRGSAQRTDARWDHPYDAYPRLSMPEHPLIDDDGDARARLRVRLVEIELAFTIIERAVQALRAEPDQTRTAPARQVADGLWAGVAEAPQGEALYEVTFAEGRVLRCFARSASLHNLVAFHDAFRGDVFTDFAFIEASFGLSYAGVAM